MKDKTHSPSSVQKYTQKFVSSTKSSFLSTKLTLCVRVLTLGLHAELLWRDRKNNEEMFYLNDLNLEKMNPHITAASGEFKSIFLTIDYVKNRDDNSNCLCGQLIIVLGKT